MSEKGQAYSYVVTVVEGGEGETSGKWYSAEGTDYAFTFIPTALSAKAKAVLVEAFEKSLKLPTLIKNAVLKTAGIKVENGLYLLKSSAMIEAINSIEGMGQTSANTKSASGDGAAIDITKQFFNAVLASLKSNVKPILKYLQNSMGKVQGQAAKSEINTNFGTVFAMTSLMPELGVAVTTLHYAFSNEKTGQWFVKIPCGSARKTSYSYDYDTVVYDYNP